MYARTYAAAVTSSCDLSPLQQQQRRRKGVRLQREVERPGKESLETDLRPWVPRVRPQVRGDVLVGADLHAADAAAARLLRVQRRLHRQEQLQSVCVSLVCKVVRV